MTPINKQQQDDFLHDFQDRQATAERMLPIIGHLFRKHGITLSIYGRSINDVSAADLLKAHRFIGQHETTRVTERDSFPVLQAIVELEPGAARIDLGKLTVAYLKSGKTETPEDFVNQQMAGRSELLNNVQPNHQDVVLYGFGRIGRLLARELARNVGSGKGLRLRAIVVRKPHGDANDLEKRASLLRRDSVHGPFNGTISVDHNSNSIIANGNIITVLYANSPDDLDYDALGIHKPLVIDNTGIWRDKEALQKHLDGGAGKVLLTAPGKGDMKNIVFGVNEAMMTDDDRILSAASCTTNAITPVLKVINDRFGVEAGHIESVHSYTNDQNLIDNYHEADRRGRSAPLNMVLTETGAAKAVAKALPELEGKLTGNAIRVPTPNVSMAIINLTLHNSTDKQGLNSILDEAAMSSPLQDQIDYMTSTELVSSDLVGSRHAGVVDSHATIVNGKHCVVYVWYDNEYGYSFQVLRMMQAMAGQVLPVFPA